MENPLDWLQSWYYSKLDGDWEHQNGIQISTLDNPGWRLSIDIWEMPLRDLPFSRIEKERSEHDWVFVWVEGGKFEARGGPNNLVELIKVFRNWIESTEARQVE